MKTFKKIPLASAVMGAFLAVPAFAADTAGQAQDSVDLDTVTVTGDRQGTKVKTNVVTAKEKDESAETDLRGLLKDEPAVSIGSGNGTSQYFYIRNMGQNSVDVKVDNGYSDSQFLYHQGRHMLDPALVKIVSVQKGAGSASAGIGQTNGAVIAKTIDAADLLKNSSNPNFGAKINTGYNTNDGHNYGASVFGKAGESVDYLIAANRVKEDDYKGGKGYINPYSNNSRVPFSALDKTGYLGKIGVNINENHRIALSHRHEQQKGERLVREEFIIGTDPRLTERGQFPALRKMTTDHTNLEWTGKDLGFAQSANANIYLLDQGRWSADDSGNNYSGGSRNSGATKYKIETIGANVNFDSHVHDNVLVKYGVNFRNQKIKPHQIYGIGVESQEKRDVGVYGEAIVDVKEVTLTAGLRYDHFDFKAMDGKKLSDGAINPSVGVIYQPIQDLSFSASHNYATRSPRMHDAQMSHGAGRVISIADGTKAEQARNTEIGFNYDNGTFGFEGSYFWQNIKNALGTGDGRDNHSACARGVNSCNIINAGRIKNKGYELGASYRYEGLTARLGVAHAKPRFYGENLSSNKEYAAAAGRTWTASLAYRFNNPDLEVGIHRRQVEKVKPEDNFFTASGQIEAATGSGKASYGVTDITANWKPLKNDKMNVNFAVNNITNKNYVPHASSVLAGAGREYRVGLNYTF